MFSRLLLALLCLLIQHEHSVSAFRRRPQTENVTIDVDHRGNRIAEAQAETLWAVRVLKAAVYPNKRLKDVWPGQWDEEQRTNMDLLWAWIEAMQRNGNGALPFGLDPPMTREANMRNENPAPFIAAIHTGHKFKNGKDAHGRPIYGMDFYINFRLENPHHFFGKMPNGDVISLADRDDKVRSQALFEKRGRVGVYDLPEEAPLKHMMLERANSIQNFHAGIVSLEHAPDEALDFFDIPVVHGGKNFNVRTGKDNTSAVFERIGAPFIAGPSGSIEYMVLSVEDDCMGRCIHGLVPFQDHKVREALLSLMTAVLIAGGQHSLGECLAVAQAMGYFSQVPSILKDYHLAAEAFESYSAETLGVAPFQVALVDSNPLGQMHTTRVEQIPNV